MMGRFTLIEGPEHVLASGETRLPGYRATFVTYDGEHLERFLTDAGYADLLRRRGSGDPTLTAEEFDEWTVEPDVTALEARYDAEAGLGG
jgi:hypothetical protein